MNIDNRVPFYENTPDNMHCFQASLKMVLKYFLPDKDFSWQELEKITAMKPELWTWPTAGVLWMQENGFDVINIEIADWQRFINEGGNYLIEHLGKNTGEEQIKHSDIVQEQTLAKKYVQVAHLETRIPEINDIRRLLHDGYLIICNVNVNALNNKPDYCGHLIVVKGLYNDGLIVHDPGLPPIENRKVDFETFEKAWAYPDEKQKNITAFKLKML